MKPINLKNPIHFLAFGFGSGLIKPAPGTWGSLAGLFFAIFLWKLTASTLFLALFTLITFIGGIKICHQASEDLKVHDDGRIVWDEIVAMLLIVAFIPQHTPLFYLLAFAFFRLFDIAKPFPIRQVDERLEGGLGIMFDDILAAIYTLISLYLIDWIL